MYKLCFIELMKLSTSLILQELRQLHLARVPHLVRHYCIVRQLKNVNQHQHLRYPQGVKPHCLVTVPIWRVSLIL